jgi:hypothetical protein
LSLPDDLFVDEEELTQAQPSETFPRQTPRRQPRNPDWWSPLPLKVLTDRKWDWLYPARVRLAHYIDITTRRRNGARMPVELTNKRAAEIGLAKQNKMRELRALAERGVVSFTVGGNRTPVVTWLGL